MIMMTLMALLMMMMMMIRKKDKNKERSVVVHVFSDIVFAIRCLCHSTLSLMMMRIVMITVKMTIKE